MVYEIVYTFWHPCKIDRIQCLVGFGDTLNEVHSLSCFNSSPLMLFWAKAILKALPATSKKPAWKFAYLCTWKYLKSIGLKLCDFIRPWKSEVFENKTKQKHLLSISSMGKFTSLNSNTWLRRLAVICPVPEDSPVPWRWPDDLLSWPLHEHCSDFFWTLLPW